jgi:hypothetical protein
MIMSKVSAGCHNWPDHGMGMALRQAEVIDLSAK